jgi:hypothetical protein
MTHFDKSEHEIGQSARQTSKSQDERGARLMRISAAAAALGLLLASTPALNAQTFCPVWTFCHAQHDHCRVNCSALTDVLEWQVRPGFVHYCDYGCFRQFNRCAVRAARRCGP